MLLKSFFYPHIKAEIARKMMTLQTTPQAFKLHNIYVSVEFEEKKQNCPRGCFYIAAHCTGHMHMSEQFVQYVVVVSWTHLYSSLRLLSALLMPLSPISGKIAIPPPPPPLPLPPLPPPPAPSPRRLSPSKPSASFCWKPSGALWDRRCSRSRLSKEENELNKTDAEWW